jgi:excisionase family DNA binding protein
VLVTTITSSANTSQPPEELLTIKQAAAYAIVSEPTVRRWITLRYFPIYRAGKQIRISKQDLARFLEKGPL